MIGAKQDSIRYFLPKGWVGVLVPCILQESIMKPVPYKWPPPGRGGARPG